MTTRRKKSTSAEKIAWLVTHRALWQGRNESWTTVQHRLVSAMKQDGLVAMSTYAPDVQLGRLLHEAEQVLGETGGNAA